MLSVEVLHAAKRFHKEWIFKNLNLQLLQGDSLAIMGANGSGKSTLLKCISGSLPLTQGSISYKKNTDTIAPEDWFRHISFASPYLELPEELTLQECISFHFKFKKPAFGLEDLSEIIGLVAHKTKRISQFSSGMKQRIKLGLALFSDVPLVLLDEPTSNLDAQGIAWYQNMVQTYSSQRILIVCSNEAREVEFCKQKITLDDFKR
ncbi:MAG: ATP-binding cassette domain-containing protein [Bacteroidota bacterium]